MQAILGHDEVWL